MLVRHAVYFNINKTKCAFCLKLKSDNVKGIGLHAQTYLQTERENNTKQGKQVHVWKEYVFYLDQCTMVRELPAGLELVKFASSQLSVVKKMRLFVNYWQMAC